MSVSVQTASTSTTTSAIRRKPKFTYQSPRPTEVRDPASLIKYSKTTSTHPASSSSFTPPPPATTKPNHLPGFSSPKSKSHLSNPSLPLYHPFGRLALSLPPLDPTKYGLPLLPRPDTELLEAQQAQQLALASANGNKSWRGTPVANGNGSRRDNSVVTATDDGAPTPVPEVKEKGSPRKRRNGGGGGGGGGSRRKRKDVDEDASYAASNKRPRYPRGAAVSAGANAEEDVLTGPIGANGTDNPDMSGIGGGEEEKGVVERRTTRSRAVARRDSTASETTSVSNSASASATRAASTARKEEGEAVGGEAVLTNNKRRSRSKEEGEVSEESK
ncbi:hypothetical protein PM082_001497 [Marasmius tenuissimus]|nr:hypothetical protein PM082_001497 [Marasmius tenuissimus]